MEKVVCKIIVKKTKKTHIYLEKKMEKGTQNLNSIN